MVLFFHALHLFSVLFLYLDTHLIPTLRYSYMGPYYWFLTCKILAKYRLLSVLSWFLRQMLGVLNFCGSKWFSSIFKESSRKIWKWRRLIYILPRQSNTYYHLCTYVMCYILNTFKAPNIFYLYMIQHTDVISYGYVYASENNTAP